MKRGKNQRIKPEIMKWLVSIHECMEIGHSRYLKSRRLVGEDVFIGTQATVYLLAIIIGGKVGEAQLKAEIAKNKQKKLADNIKGLDNAIVEAKREVNRLLRVRKFYEREA